MTKATEIRPANASGNHLAFTDPADGSSVHVNKVLPKEADGKRPGPHEVPASAESLSKLQAKFAR